MRKLSLKKDTLTELSTEDLDGVVGGSGLSCISNMICSSDFQQCITGLGCLSVGGC